MRASSGARERAAVDSPRDSTLQRSCGLGPSDFCALARGFEDRPRLCATVNGRFGAFCAESRCGGAARAAHSRSGAGACLVELTRV